MERGAWKKNSPAFISTTCPGKASGEVVAARAGSCGAPSLMAISNDAIDVSSITLIRIRSSELVAEPGGQRRWIDQVPPRGAQVLASRVQQNTGGLLNPSSPNGPETHPAAERM